MKILVSHCLLGQACRYDGKSSGDLEQTLRKLGFASTDIFALCPEQAGGLPTPRVPCERAITPVVIRHGTAKVLNRAGEDMTKYFLLGAEMALALVKREQITVALLKSKSPSCGVHSIYDGTFQGRLRLGMGLTAELLDEHGVKLFDETELPALAAWLESTPHDVPLG